MNKIARALLPIPQCIIVLGFSAQFASGQNIITTFAGSPKSFITHPGLPAATTSVAPSRVATGPNGAVYFGEREANVVLQITANGVLQVVAGNGVPGYSGDGGPATAASLNQPSGLAVDAAGNLYIADLRNARVRKVDTNGIITTVAGNGVPGYSGDGGPATSASLGYDGQLTLSTLQNTPAQYEGGIAVDASGNLYIADTENGVVRKVSNGVINTLAPFQGVMSVAVDAAGNVYMSSADSQAPIVRLSPSGSLTTLAATAQALSLAVDANGNLYAGLFAGTVDKVSATGVLTVVAGGVFAPNGSGSIGDGGPATSASISEPFGIALDASGNLFIADVFNERIRKVDLSGTINTVAGNGVPNYSGDNGPAAAAGLAFPNSIALDPGGVVYIADDYNSRIRRVDASGEITTVYYMSGFFPAFVAPSPDGGVFVAQGRDSMVVKISSDGTVTTVAGNTPGTALIGVLGLASDSAGNLYILEVGAIQELGANGAFTTVPFQPNVYQGFAITPAGNLLLAGTTNVQMIVPGSGATSTIPVNMASQITGVAGDSAGNIYVSDSGNHSQVLKISLDGSVAPYAGNNGYGYSGDGGPAFEATIFGPTGLAVDAAGDLFIADSVNNRVREVLAVPAAYQAAPASLSFSATAGGTPPATQAINLTSTIAGIAFTAFSNAAWLAVSPSAGTIPGSVQVTADPTSLTAGTYQGTVTIETPTAAPGTTTIAVTFTVLPTVPPQLSVITKSLAFSAVAGSGSLSDQLQVANTGSGTLSFTASAATISGGAWLSVTPLSGTATPAISASLTVTANTGSLAAGTYQGAVTITGAGVTVNIPVTLSITAPSNVLLLSQSGLTFTAAVGGGAPLPQTFGILNVGQSTMSWTAQASILSGSTQWLSITPTSGELERPYLDVSVVTVTVNPTGLPQGVYYGQIQVTASAVNSPQTITVLMNILPAGANPGPQVQPSGLIFTGSPGSAPGSQNVLVGTLKSEADDFISGMVGTGFSYLPANASVQPNQPATLLVYPDLSALSPGDIEHGVITLLFSDGTPRTISVLIVVAPAEAADSRSPHPESQTGNPCSSNNLLVQPASLQQNFMATLGQAQTIATLVADECGNLLGPGIAPGSSVSASFSTGDSPVSLTPIGNGLWTGTMVPVQQSGPVVVSLTASNGNGATGQATVPGTLVAGASTPIVTSAGIVSAATDLATPIAPGGLITIYGANLATNNFSATTLPLPNQESGVEALMGGRPVPLLYVGSKQMNVQVPFDLPPNTKQQVTFQSGQSFSVPATLVVAESQPGIFTLNEQGNGQGDIENQDSSLNGPSNPAHAGEVVMIFCTGLGAVSPAVQAGTAAPSDTLSHTVNTVTVQIGGQNAQVQFAGLAPGYAGLYQVNAYVPTGLTAGAVPVVLQVAGQTSPSTVTMAVQ